MADSVTDDIDDNKEAAHEADEKMRLFRRWFMADDDHCRDWLDDAREDYRFVAGRQYTEQEKAELGRKNRPDIVFNRLAPMVRSVAGYQANQKLATTCLPREPGDEQSAEIGNSMIRWYRDQSDASFSDSDAFQDAVTCGMGWTDTKLDYDDDPEGKPVLKRKNPLNMRWDHKARERNLKDARRVWEIIEDIPLDEAKEQFPNIDPADLNATWVSNAFGEEAESQDEADRYEGEWDEPTSSAEKMVTIVRLQYIDRETYYRTVDPFTGEIISLSVQEFVAVKKRIPGIQGVKQRRKVFRQVYLGKTVLEEGPTPCADHFSLQCVTGFRDEEKGTFHGLVTGLKDPQRWSNKWMSQTLHILNSSAKGGVMMEAGAVENQRKFEQTWARNDEVTFLKQGALSQNKVQPKPQTAFPAGFYQLMDMAINAMRDVSGVNLEMLGQRDANQPGVLESQRKSAALTTLTVLFECMRMYRRTQGEMILSLVKKYVPIPTMKRVVGDQFAPLLPQFLQSDRKFDIVVDEAPDSPNAKEIIWQSMGQSIHQQPPQVQAVLWKHSPLPGSAAAELSQAIQSAMQPPPPDPNQQAAMQAQMQADQAKVAADVRKAELDVEGKQLDNRKAEIELMMAQQNAQANGVKMDAETVKAIAMSRKAAFEAAGQGAIPFMA